MRRGGDAPRTVEKLDFIEGMRGVAALYVVLSHFATMADPRTPAGHTPTSPEWLQWLLSPFWYGHLAVAIFIVISGYCLQTSRMQREGGKLGDAWTFFKRRALRILPAYYACLLLSTAVALTVTVREEGMPWEQYLPVTVENFLAHVFLVHNLSPDWMYKINGVLWSIAIEVQLYLLFPLLLGALAKVGRAAFVGLTATVAAGILLAAPESIKLYPWYLALFALGMAAAHLAYRPDPKRGPRPWLAGTVAAFAAIACVAGGVLGWSMPVRDALGGLVVAGLMVVGSVTPWNRITRVFTWRPLLGLGLMSYSLYLMHHPIQQVVFYFRPGWVVDEATALAWLYLAALPAALFGSWLFSLAFERPFLGRKTTAAPTPVRGLRTHVPLVRFGGPVAEPVATSHPKAPVEVGR